MSENSTLLPVITTSCKDCVFAEWESHPEIEEVQGQKGCKLGRLDKFADKEIIESPDDIFYYQINGRICNAARDKEWANAIDGDKIEAVRREIQFDYDLIVNITNEEKSTKAIQFCLKELSALAVKPKSVLFIHHLDSELNNIDIYKATRQVSDSLKISVETVYDDNTLNNKMNKAANRCKATYFIFMELTRGFDTFGEIVNRLDHFLNVEMGRFMVIEDDKFFLCHLQAFKNVGGNGKKMAVEKIKELSDEQNTEYLIKKLSDFAGATL